MDTASAALWMLMAILPPAHAARWETTEALRDVLRKAGCEATVLSMQSIAKGQAVEVVVRCQRPQHEPTMP